MKKLFTILTVVAISTTMSFAQDLTSKKGESYLPESNEWSIGFDATSTLNYVGNLFNAGATAPTADYLVANTVYGKMMTSENSAWRLTVGLNMSKNIDNSSVPDLNSSASAGDMVEDKYTFGSTQINLMLGKEFRRGTTRLQGVYGAEVGLGIMSQSEKWEYGNSAEDRGALLDNTEVKSGLGFGIGLRAFIGAEYFVLPKVSISGEYGWSFGFFTQGGSSTTTETYDPVDDDVDTDTFDGASDSSFGISNDNSGGRLGLHLYF
tara:strand:+ start:522 stop:1313 length:792 start_codon:yes stop_codon:yes gene_type:complete